MQSTLPRLHHVENGNASMVRSEHLTTLVGMGLVVGVNGRLALTVEGLTALTASMTHKAALIGRSARRSAARR
jgi:hypothetical protein